MDKNLKKSVKSHVKMLKNRGEQIQNLKKVYKITNDIGKKLLKMGKKCRKLINNQMLKNR